MPWCPVCKNEYKDGFTLCADCGAELVDFLEQDTKSSEITICDEIEASYDDPKEAEEADTANTVKKEHIKPFVKAKDRAENYKSSAFSLLLVGVLGIIFLALVYLKIIPGSNLVNISPLVYVVMGALFIIFVVMGVKSFKDAKQIENSISDEEALNDKIYSYFKNNVSPDMIDEIAFKSESVTLSEEEKFFPRSNAIRQLINSNFGELDEAYLTELTENIYSNTYEG